MATNNLKVTELDFDAIKQNLRDYLRDSSVNPEFQDYDFEASGLNVLLNILAYNTHYNAYYLNMVANEAFLDTAKLRPSVVSLAKSLGYTPHSTNAPVASVNVTVLSENTTTGELIIPAYYQFQSNQIDGTSFTFNTLEQYTATKSAGNYYFENVNIYEGQIVTYRFTYNELSNPKQVFTLPDENIDTSTLKVAVLPSSTSSSSTPYTLVSDILNTDASSEVFYLQESAVGRYEVYFGNDYIGKKLTNGNIVIVTYLVTNGTAANKANNFVGTSSLTDSLDETLTTITVEPVSEAVGGIGKEDIDSIKYSASTSYTAQNRLVTQNDYSSYILNKYPSIDSVSVWGGEDETPPVFGKVYISMKPKTGYYLSESEKTRILTDIVGPKAVLSIDPEIRDPEYLYVKLSTNIKYDTKKTVATPDVIKTSVKNKILEYFNLNVNQFNSTFAISKLNEEIDNMYDAIIGIQTTMRLEKKFIPALSTNSTYTINFNASLYRGTLINRLVSDQFDVLDNSGTRRTAILEEVPESFTGIADILITNGGTGYTSQPTVTITGDGTGATATAKIVNGKIESFTITNRGINYSRALITVSGGGGFGATAVVVLNSRYGTLRTVYFDSNAERKVINPTAGTIDYDSGQIVLNNLNVLSTSSTSGYIKLNVQSESEIISSIKNTLIVIDSTDSSSITTTLTAV